MMKPNNESKRKAAHLAHIIIHAYEFEAFCYFVTLDDLDVTIEDKRLLNPEQMEILVSMPQDTDPESLVKRWKRWEKEELLFDYAMQN